MSKRDWSEKDLVNKWGRKLPDDLQRSLPWQVLSQLVLGLSDDTQLPRERLTECIRTRDISGLFEIANNLDVTEYTSSDLLLQDRLVAELFSKYDFADSPFNKRDKAKLRFFEAEERCRETNFRVSRSTGLTNEINSVLHTAIRLIDRILGSFDLDAMLRSSRFGPGASLCVGGPFTTEYFKLCEKAPTVFGDAFPYAEALLACDHKWAGYLQGIHPFDIAGPFSPVTGDGIELTVVNHNKVAFVPKNAKTERSIAIEPYFNVYFQLGVGAMIRERLYRYCGINLDSQTRNQALALAGSIDDKLATIDFSMASDTISIETVRLLLPPQWFNHMDRLRCRNYKMEGVIRPYQKFSSMGNGYTFELETLIFYAVASACCTATNISSEDVTVFGDDVVLPTKEGTCALFQEVCEFLGFKINEEKSFISGPFRESCGEDYLKGHRVRPVFCKELRTVQHVASLSNRLLALNRAVGFGSRLNVMLCSTVDLLRAHIPRDVRKFVVGPPTEDVDGYIHEDAMEKLSRSPLVKWNRKLFAWEYPTIRFRPKELTRRDDAAALFAIWSTAVRRSPIPKPKVYVEALKKLPFGYTSDLSDFIKEAVPRTITGRKIGRLSMGHSLAWQLGDNREIDSWAIARKTDE